MKKQVAILFAGMAFIALSAAAEAATINIFNTGVNASGAVVADGTSPDLHYTLTTVPTGETTTVRTKTSASGFPVGYWVADNPLSTWIGPDNGDSLIAKAGTYEYTTTFDLTGLDFTTASLSGQWATDNSGTDIRLNGNLLAITASGFASFTSFLINSGFVAGINTLAFLVSNNIDQGDNPTGLRVEISGTADTAAVPVPAALPLFAAGLGAMGWMARRRKRNMMAEGLATA